MTDDTRREAVEKMPERIWVNEYFCAGTSPGNRPENVEYIRADLYDAGAAHADSGDAHRQGAEDAHKDWLEHTKELRQALAEVREWRESLEIECDFLESDAPAAFRYIKQELKDFDAILAKLEGGSDE